MILKEEYKRLVGIIKSKSLARNEKLRNEDIAKILGYNRSYFSSLLGARGVVTEDHIKDLYLHFPYLKDDRKLNNDDTSFSINDFVERWNFTLDGLAALSGISKDRIETLYSNRDLPQRKEIEILNIIQENLTRLESIKDIPDYRRAYIDSIGYGLKIKAIREKEGISTKEFADKVDLLEKDIKNIEERYFQLTDDRIEKLLNLVYKEFTPALYFKGEKEQLRILAINIKTIRSLFKETPSEFARRFKYVSSALQNAYEEAEAVPSPDYLMKLDFLIEWLHFSIEKYLLGDEQIKQIQDYVEKKQDEDFRRQIYTAYVYYIRKDNIDRYVNMLTEGVNIENAFSSEERFGLPPDVHPEGAIWRYFESLGTLDHIISENDILLVSQVPKEDWISLNNYDSYYLIIEQSGRILISQIFQEGASYLFIYNPPPRSGPRRFISLGLVKEIWLLRRVIKRIPAITQSEKESLVQKRINHYEKLPKDGFNFIDYRIK